jgi:hypothetical protein
VTSIDPVNVKTISKPELTSLHGGNVPAILEQNAITPLETTYAVRLKSLNNNKYSYKPQRSDPDKSRTRKRRVYNVQTRNCPVHS